MEAQIQTSAPPSHHVSWPSACAVIHPGGLWLLMAGGWSLVVFSVLSIPCMEGVLVGGGVCGCIGLPNGCLGSVTGDMSCLWCRAAQVLCSMSISSSPLSFSLSLCSFFFFIYFLGGANLNSSYLMEKLFVSYHI